MQSTHSRPGAHGFPEFEDHLSTLVGAGRGPREGPPCWVVTPEILLLEEAAQLEGRGHSLEAPGGGDGVGPHTPHPSPCSSYP